MKVVQMSPDRWLNVQNAICIYNGLIFNLKKESKFHTWCNIESIENIDYVEGDKQVKNDQYSVIVLVWIPSIVKFMHMEVEWQLPQRRGRSEWGVV